MTKTALQQLIERLWTTTRIHKIETGVSRSYVDIEDVILLIKESLPTEKQQMEDAFTGGWVAYSDSRKPLFEQSKSDYFTTKYQQDGQE